LKKLWDTRSKNGLDGLRDMVKAAGQKQLDLAKKFKEFPNDTDTANELGAAQSEIRLLKDALAEMA